MSGLDRIMINFSVIILHFGPEELLQRCIASIPKRNDTEVIVIRDHEQIGAGWARNQGLAKANGKWLLFVDSDDFLEDNADCVFDMVAEREEDILFFYNRTVMSDNIAVPSNRYNFESCFTTYFKNGDESALRYGMPSLWGKFFKRSLILDNNIRFDEVHYSNDVYFSFLSGYYANKIAVFNTILYVLTEREGSLVSGRCKSMSEWSQRYAVALRKWNFVQKHNLKYNENGYKELLLVLHRNNKMEFHVELKKLVGSRALPAFLSFYIMFFFQMVNRHLKRMFHRSNSGV